jgi:hypothetical protein
MRADSADGPVLTTWDRRRAGDYSPVVAKQQAIGGVANGHHSGFAEHLRATRMSSDHWGRVLQ